MTENIATTDLGFQDYDFRPSVCPSCGGVLVGPSGRYVAGEEGRVRWSTVCDDCGHGVGWETYSEFGDEGHHTRFDWVSEDGESAVRVPDDAEMDADRDFFGDRGPTESELVVQLNNKDVVANLYLVVMSLSRTTRLDRVLRRRLRDVGA